MTRNAYPPADAYDEPAAARRRSGCWLLVIVLTLLVICLGGAIVLLIYLAGEPNEIEVDITAPGAVTLNEPFALEITVRNVGVDPATITGFGVETTLLEGIDVTASDPAYASISERNYPLVGDWREFNLDAVLAPGESLLITVTLTPTQSGPVEGDIMVWVENEVLGVPFTRAGRAPLELEIS
ncbi:MAG: hypothetical protein GXY36_14450 [Chloroflexi bacterium]|nr:hypothetical protein [Chloroflexota bacterium]